jgi:hypothetical protein
MNMTRINVSASTTACNLLTKFHPQSIHRRNDPRAPRPVASRIERTIRAPGRVGGGAGAELRLGDRIGWASPEAVETSD